ncbi:hypothetical protein HRI_000078800 [Hibiscus trionum]|uniref:Uncharacterized protein n=1 Tax=Hibiscus trionum TaxID=183268 RepID=A0A9W7GQZ9_HIBTR|nr:hypothetical protein HRI_000078800 [Hibiscus trionum]
MVEGVRTRGQTAQNALNAQQTDPGLTDPASEEPQWQQETTRLQSEISTVKDDIVRLDSKMEERMSEMRTAILSELQKLIGIALGKSVAPESTATPAPETAEADKGILGPHPSTKSANSSGQQPLENTIFVEEDEPAGGVAKDASGIRGNT